MRNFKTLQELEEEIVNQKNQETHYSDIETTINQKIMDFFMHWRFGYTTKEDEKEIFEYNENLKNYDSYYHSGLFYALGIHVDVDLAKAREYFTLAVNKKDYIAALPLALMAEIYTENPNYSKLYKIYKSSPDYSDEFGFCFFNIGRMHLYGLGCSPDEALTRKYLTRAYKLLYYPSRHLYNLVYPDSLYPELQALENVDLVPNDTNRQKTIAALAALLSNRFDISRDSSMLNLLKEASKEGYEPAKEILNNINNKEYLKDITFRWFLMDSVLQD